MVSTLPESAGALADAVHHRRSLGLHPVECIQHVIRHTVLNQRNLTDFIAAVVSLQGRAIRGSRTKRLGTALQVSFILGFDVGHQLGVFFADGFFVDRLNDGILQCFRHRQALSVCSGSAALKAQKRSGVYCRRSPASFPEPAHS